ncbi:response regulator [Sediminibacterium roseum]|uniref:Response regulator n=1 Tax=Sediminibacterium roseum TaxID=1978412 RepID=A0ABW9ZWU4_9BACT|nr:response regulator [Sediminibacterium roseum]NCI50518.1 response regulator [Sediminibacterium roseum]
MKTNLIFVVDDDMDDLMLFQDAMNEIDSQIKIETAGNGVDAIKKLTQGLISQPDYIFIDLNMPLMNGIQCLQEIKKMPAYSSIPVIIYSTSSYERDILQTINSGAFHYIVKPFSFQELCEKLKKVLAMPK